MTKESRGKKKEIYRYRQGISAVGFVDFTILAQLMMLYIII